MSDEQRRVLDLLAQGKITVDGADALLRALAAQPGSEPAAAPAGGTVQDEADVTLHDKPARKWRGMLGFGAVRVPPTERSGARYLKIEVHKPAADGRPGENAKNVSIRVPIALVRGGMRLGTIIGFYADEKVQQRLRARGIDLDLSKIDKADIDDLLQNMGEITMNVDKGKSQVRITCE